MKRFLALLAPLVLLALPPTVEGATATMQSLTAATAVTADDIFWMVNDPLGVPADRKITAENIRAYMTNGLAVASTVPPPAVVGNTLHVEEHGDDGTGTGSVDYPFRSLTAAFVTKVAGDEIVMGPGTFDFTVTAAASSTAEANRLVSNFAVRGAGKGITFVSVIPRGTNEHNRVLSVPASTPVTNVLFSGFTLDGNASDYAWDTGGKLDWILQGQNITLDGVEVVDWGGHSTQEAFSPLLQSVTNAVVTHSVFRSTGSVYTAGPTAMDAAHVRFINNYVADYNLAFGLVNSLYDIEISHNQVTNVNYFVNNDTATSGALNVRITDNSAVGDAGSAVRGIQVTYGGKQWWRIERNTIAYFPQGIWIRSPNASGTNYFLNGVIADNLIPASTLLGISVGESTNGFYRNNKVYYNSGSFPATNYVSGSNNYGWGHVKPDGSLWADLPNTLQGAGGGITYTGSANNGNLATSVDTLQELNDAVDNLTVGAGSSNYVALSANYLVVSNQLEVLGPLILSGSGGSGLDSINVTNKLTNSVLTATRVTFAGADEALTDDADLTFATDTLNATKLTSTDVRAGLGVITNSLNLANVTASRALASDGSKYVTNAPGAWTSVTLDTTNAVIDLAGSVPGVDRNYYYSLSTSNQVIFSNLVQGAQGTIWVNAAGTARQMAWSGSYDNFSTNDVTWDSGTFLVTNRAIIAYKVGWGTDATNVMLAIKRK